MPYEADIEVFASSPTQENPMFDVLQGFQSSMEKQLGQVSEHLKSIDERMSALETISKPPLKQNSVQVLLIHLLDSHLKEVELLHQICRYVLASFIHTYLIYSNLSTANN